MNQSKTTADDNDGVRKIVVATLDFAAGEIRSRLNVEDAGVAAALELIERLSLEVEAGSTVVKPPFH